MQEDSDSDKHCDKPIIIALVILIGIPSIVFASASNSEDSDLTAEEKELWFKNQGQRPTINEDFDPDESCLFVESNGSIRVEKKANQKYEYVQKYSI